MKKFLLVTISILLWQHMNAQDFEWAKGMGGAGDDQSYSNAIDASGNVYSTGWFSETVDFDPSPAVFSLTSAGDNDAFVLKLDLDGELLWAKRIGNIHHCRAFSIAVDNDDNVYVMGYFQFTVDLDPGSDIHELTSQGNFDIFLIKLSSDGDFIWAKTMGGVSAELGLSISFDADDNIYTTGRFSSTADFDPGPDVYNLTSAGVWDIFVSKLDPSGGFIWARSFSGPSYDNGISIAVDDPGNVYVTGQFQGTADFDPGSGVLNLISNGSYDIFICKLDPSGNFLWASSYGDGTNDSGQSITTDDFGNVYATGGFSGIVDFDPGPGVYNLSSSAGSGFILKLDASGGLVWVIQLEGGGSSIVLDPEGNAYICGAQLSKADPFGNLVWTHPIGGSGRSIALDPNHNLYITGSFSDTADLDPGPGVFVLNSIGESDIFITKLSQDLNVMVPELDHHDLLIFPNPAGDRITITITITITSITSTVGEVLIYDAVGKLVQQEQISGPSGAIDMRGINPGSYVVRVAGHSHMVMKL